MCSNMGVNARLPRASMLTLFKRIRSTLGVNARLPQRNQQRLTTVVINRLFLRTREDWSRKGLKKNQGLSRVIPTPIHLFIFFSFSLMAEKKPHVCFLNRSGLKNLVKDFFFNNLKKQSKGTLFRSFFLKSNSFMTFYSDFFGQRLFLVIDCQSISVYISV